MLAVTVYVCIGGYSAGAYIYSLWSAYFCSFLRGPYTSERHEDYSFLDGCSCLSWYVHHHHTYRIYSNNSRRKNISKNRVHKLMESLISNTRAHFQGQKIFHTYRDLLFDQRKIQFHDLIESRIVNTVG